MLIFKQLWFRNYCWFHVKHCEIYVAQPCTVER